MPKYNPAELFDQLVSLIGREEAVAFDHAVLTQGLTHKAYCQAYKDKIFQAKRDEAADAAYRAGDRAKGENWHDVAVKCYAAAADIQINGGWFCEGCCTRRPEDELSCAVCDAKEIQELNQLAKGA